jgi:hypothetical protein
MHESTNLSELKRLLRRLVERLSLLVSAGDLAQLDGFLVFIRTGWH